MRAWFKNDYSEISEKIFKVAYSEYIDTSERFANKEFELVSQIHYLNNRINCVKLCIIIQKEFINNFGKPYIPDFGSFKKFGYTLYWKNNINDFLLALTRIESTEKKNVIKLEAAKKKLIEERAKSNSGESSDLTKESRHDFIKMLNVLGKIGYKIDKDKTTVEELALIIKEETKK